MESIDLSAPLRQDPPDWPDALRVDVADHGHAEGAAQIESLLGALSPAGFRVACFPLKVEGGSAGPARVVGIVG